MYSVVGARTICKNDFVVSSISSFVAPRGSTSSNLFKMLSVTISVSGFLGVFRWHMVGARVVVTNLGLIGFACLLLVALFDFDVLPQRFLEGKLRSTKWLMDKLLKKKGLSRPFPFHKANLLRFVRASPLIYHLYDEDHHIASRQDSSPRSHQSISKSRNRSTSRSRSNSKGQERKIGKSRSRNRNRSSSSSRSRSRSTSGSHDEPIRTSPDAKVEMRILARAGLVPDMMTSISGLLHMVGAIGFVFCTTIAVLMQEPSETLIIGPVAGFFFLPFLFYGVPYWQLRSLVPLYAWLGTTLEPLCFRPIFHAQTAA